MWNWQQRKEYTAINSTADESNIVVRALAALLLIVKIKSGDKEKGLALCQPCPFKEFCKKNKNPCIQAIIWTTPKIESLVSLIHLEDFLKIHQDPSIAFGVMRDKPMPPKT